MLWPTLFITFQSRNCLSKYQCIMAPRQCDRTSVCERCALSTCCTFSNLFIWIKAWSVFSIFIIINTKETFARTLRLLVYINNQKIGQCNVTSNLEDMVHMLHFLRHSTSWSCFVLHLLISLRWLTDYKGKKWQDIIYILDWK